MKPLCCTAMLLVLTAGLIGQSPARPKSIPVMAGSWNGFYENDANPADQGPASLEVGKQTGRRLTAAITLKNFRFMLDGLIRPDHTVRLAGQAGDAALTIEGLDQAFGGGFIAELHYTLAAPDGAMERGVLLVVQDVADPRAPNVVGAWQGTYGSAFARTAGNAALPVVTQAASRFAGVLTFQGQPPFNCEGTIRADGRLLLVGLGLGGRLFAKGRFQPGATATLPGVTPNVSRAVVNYHLAFVAGALDFGQIDLTRGSVSGR